MYFRLKPEIYLFLGKRQSILCDVLNGNIIAIDSETTDILRKAELNNSVQPNKHIKELMRRNWIDHKENPVYVEKIRYTNVYNKTRAWNVLPALLHNDFWLIYDCAKKYFDNVTVHITSIRDVCKFNKDDKLVLSLFNDEDAKSFSSLDDYKNLTVLYDKEITGVQHGLKVNMKDNKINKETFKNKRSFENIFARMLYDDCLFGKLVILHNGTIVPCLGLFNHIVGNLDEQPLPLILKELYQKYWAISVDDRNKQKCTECAYRYNCFSCTKFTNESCDYDVLEGVWK